MKTVYLIRHAETIDMHNGFMNTDQTRLTEFGVERIKLVAKSQIKDLNIEAIISSPLMRTRQTTNILVNTLKLEGISIIYNDLAKEREFGSLKGGISLQKFLKLNNIHYKDLDSTETVETLKEVYSRADRLLTELRLRDEANILVVSHGIFGRALKHTAEKLNYQNEYSQDYNYQENFINFGEIIKIIEF